MIRWTAGMVETLKKARDDGHSFSHCAEIVSRTHDIYVGRNAAIGKAKRLGLLNDGRSYARSPKPKASRPKPFASVNAVRRKERLERSPAQVILRWHIQHGLSVIPKSEHADRLAQNFAALEFELSADDMAALDRLDSNHRTGPDPDEFDYREPL